MASGRRRQRVVVTLTARICCGWVAATPRPRRGHSVETRACRYIAFNHGGGYRYRLCPRTEDLTEACFQKDEHQLDFASDEHVVLFADGPKRIKNTIVADGGGTGWMMNPIPMPNFVGSDCDDMTGHPCGGCPCGSGYPGGNTNESFPNPFGEDLKGKNAAIVDAVRVPDVPAGEYVVGFRWDAETSSQVWSSCADVTIVASVG